MQNINNVFYLLARKQERIGTLAQYNRLRRRETTNPLTDTADRKWNSEAQADRRTCKFRVLFKALKGINLLYQCLLKTMGKNRGKSITAAGI